MSTYSLIKTISATFHILLGLCISLLALPFFALYRLLLFLIFISEKLMQAFLVPTLAIYFPLHSHFLLQWRAFKALPPIQPFVKYWMRIVCCTLLAIETVIALTIFVKSSMLFFPWFFKHPHPPRTRSDYLFFIAVYTASCAPLMCIAGVATALVYYLRKYWKYGKYEKKMRRKPGGRGYWKDPTDAWNKAKAKVAETLSPESKVEKPQEVKQTGSADKVEKTEWDEATLYGGERKEGGFPQRPGAAVTAPEPVPTAPWEGNKFTKKGVADIWVDRVKDQFKGGYDGRATRRKQWNEDVEKLGV